MAFSNFRSVFDGRNRTIAPFGWQRDDSSNLEDHSYRAQPRVPKGNPDGGQWRDSFGATSGGAKEGRAQGGEVRLDQSWIRLAGNEKPPGSPRLLPFVLAWKAYELIQAYRKRNPPKDLFGDREEPENSTVAVTTINGRDIYGVNSGNHDYTAEDDAAARRMRAALIAKYSDIMSTTNIGQFPNNALFHAEVTTLLRAARDNGGTLAGKTFEVFVDNTICADCKDVLPLVGKELGDPTVIFADITGARRIMRGGQWLK